MTEGLVYASRFRLAISIAVTGLTLFVAGRGDCQPQGTQPMRAVPPRFKPPPGGMPATNIAGTVRDPSGAPVSGAMVTFYPGHFPGANLFSTTNTDLQGHYDLFIPASTPRITTGGFFPTNHIIVRSLERNMVAIAGFLEVPNHMDFDLKPGITVTGSARDFHGSPITNATVDLGIVYDRTIVQLSGYPQRERKLVSVDTAGRFSIPALPQGYGYHMFPGDAVAEGYGLPSANVTAAMTLADHYEIPPLIFLRFNQVLAGQVVSVDGQPASGVSITLQGGGQLAEIGKARLPAVQSDNQGRFRIEGIAEGPASLRVVDTIGRNSMNVKVTGGDTNVVIRLSTR